MPLMKRTIDMAHVNLTACFSAGIFGTGSRSDDSRECKRCMKAGQEGEERYKLIYIGQRSFCTFETIL